MTGKRCRNQVKPESVMRKPILWMFSARTPIARILQRESQWIMETKEPLIVTGKLSQPTFEIHTFDSLFTF